MCLGLFAPLAGFLILMLFSAKLSRLFVSWIGCLSIFVSFVNFALLFYYYMGHSPDTVTLFNWIPVKGIESNFTLRLDHLSLLMGLIITGIGFLIHVYSVGYMEHEEDYARYFACLNFFVFAMLLLVLAENLLLLFVGWEGVGLASYLLIGYYYTRPAAAQAATKAFVVNRIGDAGLLMGILLTLGLFGTTDIMTINETIATFAVGAPIITVLTFLYFIGASGKSAQVPLHIWLADAMEGPTPVSALIHAATMVTAGVYLVVRLHPTFLHAPNTLLIIGIIGAITSLFAALCALSQTDLKRVLAYSTVSQLGLMFLACGAGAFYSAMFHLTTHAFVKANLFLSAGNVLHALNGSTNIEKMGGLKKILKKTHWFFLIGVLALSGIPPLATFFSKDLILEQEYLAGYEFLFYIGLGASILTGFYLMRAYCLTFLGDFRLDQKLLKAAHEVPKIMWIPVAVLAFLSTFGGFIGFKFGNIPPLEGFLKEIRLSSAEKASYEGSIFSIETYIAVAAAVLGVSLSYLTYTRFLNRLGKPFEFLRRAFFLDEIFDFIIVRPLKAIGGFIAYVLEPLFFEGMLRGGAVTLKNSAEGLQRVQSGEIRSYVAWLILGTLFVMAYFAF